MATKIENAWQVEALDKHRRKGQQTVVVEHVHVNDGGQRIKWREGLKGAQITTLQ
ncbi:hypothetical protein [Hyphomonas chukchiensis]|uniref:hypothetical protein n=1 Tax=Hyphomonas chukchiensis TaxID=1280947 RepID=UPI0030F5E84E